jgi:hypothetical protein
MDAVKILKVILFYGVGKPLEDGQARPKHVRQCNILNKTRYTQGKLKLLYNHILAQETKSWSCVWLYLITL